MTDSNPDPDEVIEQLQTTTDDLDDELANDLDASIGNLSQQIDMEGDGPNPMPIGPQQGIELIRPMVAQKAQKDPEAVLRFLATVHLEAGALLEKHSSVDPVDLL